tara:strand:+ start:1068 stop:2642 length:1575 start_codon:yes stop_codon:yes gene_type:complete
MIKKIVFLSIIVFISCKRATNNSPHQIRATNSIEKEDDTLSLNQVVITGTTDDINAFKYLSILNNTYLFGKPHQKATKQLFSDSIHMVLKSIEEPLLSEVSTAGDSAFYRGNIFLIPGDTISIRIKNKTMTFFGKNAILNNFWSEMNKQTPDYNKNPYLGSINLYKENVASIYTKKVAFFNQYINKHHIKSELFINTIKTDLKHHYLINLVYPANEKSNIKGHYFNEFDGLTPIIQKETSRNPEVIIDLSNYFGKISIEEFKNVNALHNSVFFKSNINAYIRYYFLDSQFLGYSKEQFLAEKEFIQKNFDGEIENYAIARMIRDYHLKGFGNSLNTIDLLKNSIDEYDDKFTKPSYTEFMNEIKKDLASYDFKLSESALNSQFININGDTLTLKKIFSRSNNRIKVVDFWATWCPPCIKQIKEGKTFKDRLQVENNVEWIYISSEKNRQKWLEKNKEFEHVLNSNNSFFLLNGQKSSLINSLKVKGIPRYVIFNKKNTIVLNNAPSPSDKEIFERIIDKIYNEK